MKILEGGGSWDHGTQTRKGWVHLWNEKKASVAAGQWEGRQGAGVGQIMPGSCMNIWILFREPWGPTGRSHPGIVCFGVSGRLLLLLSGDIPGGRGECQQEGLLGSHVGRSPDQRAWWPGETVMLERWWRKTPAPCPLLREPDCSSPAHCMQGETHCSPPTGGNGPEVA